MRIVRLLCVFSVLTVACFQMKAQSFTAVDVHLPYTVMVGTQQLSPDDYTIKPISEMPNMFAVYKDGGRVFEMILPAVPIESSSPARSTDLVLRGNGDEFVMDQMWIEGLDTGYQFLTHESAESREGERRVAVIPASKGL